MTVNSLLRQPGRNEVLETGQHTVRSLGSLTHDGGHQLRPQIVWRAQIRFCTPDSSDTTPYIRVPITGTAQITPSEFLLSAAFIADVWVDADGCLSGTTDVTQRVPEADRPYVEALTWIKRATNISQERIARLLGVSRQAIHLWEQGKALKDANRRRLLAVKDILERASLRHSTPDDLAAWLDTPRGADARTPGQLLEAGEIDRARVLAVSTPSSRLSRAPAWVKRPIPETFRVGGERRQQALPPVRDDELFARFGEPGSEQDKEAE